MYACTSATRKSLFCSKISTAYVCVVAVLGVLVPGKATASPAVFQHQFCMLTYLIIQILLHLRRLPL